MNEFLRQAASAGGLVTGGPVEEPFTKGWGRPPFLKGKLIAHHWTADRSIELGGGAYGLVSACDIKTVATAQVPLLGAGNLPYCVRCENALMARARRQGG